MELHNMTAEEIIHYCDVDGTERERALVDILRELQNTIQELEAEVAECVDREIVDTKDEEISILQQELEASQNEVYQLAQRVDELENKQV